MRFGHESDSVAFKDFMEHAYLLDRQITSLRNQSSNPHTGQNQQQPSFNNAYDPQSALPHHDARLGHPRLDRKTSTASFKLATQQSFPSGQQGYNMNGLPNARQVPQAQQVSGVAGKRTQPFINVVSLTESNLRTHDKLHPPKKRSVRAWLEQCKQLELGRSPDNMKTVSDPSHMDYIANRLQAQSGPNG